MQRDLLRELAQLVRYAEVDGRNIGLFIAGHASELARLLESHESELLDAVDESDGALVDRLRVRLDLAFDGERARRHEQDIERAHRAARELGRTARWFELGVALDVDVVLGDLLANPRCKLIRFELPTTSVRAPTELLRRARLLRRTYLDAAVFIDESGTHFRWKGGRGALNLHTAEPNVRTERDALVVEVPERRTCQLIPIGDALTEIGFGA